MSDKLITDIHQLGRVRVFKNNFGNSKSIPIFALLLKLLAGSG